MGKQGVFSFGFSVFSKMLGTSLISLVFGLLVSTIVLGEEDIVSDAITADRAMQLQAERLKIEANFREFNAAKANAMVLVQLEELRLGGGNKKTFLAQTVFGTSMIEAREEIAAIVTNRVLDLTFLHDLDEQQQSKLLLAASGDIARLFRKFNELYDRAESARDELNEWPQLVAEATRLAIDRRELLNIGSLFSKVSQRIVADQSKSGGKTTELLVLERQRKSRHLALVIRAVQEVERKVSFEPNEYEKLSLLLAREIPPPISEGNYDDMLVKYQVARLPDKKWQPIFDEARWPAIRNVLDRFLEFEPVLRRQGVLLTEVTTDAQVTNESSEVNLPADALKPELSHPCRY